MAEGERVRVLGPSAACCREVLDRLLQRLTQVLEEVDLYQKKKQSGDEKGIPMNVDGAQTSASVSWPSLQVRRRIDALRAHLSERRGLWESVQRVDLLLKQVEAESLIDLSSATATPGRLAGDIRNGGGRDALHDALAHEDDDDDGDEEANNNNNNNVKSCSRHCSTSGTSVQDLRVRHLVWLHQQQLRHGSDIRALRQRATRAYEALRSNLDCTPTLCDNIFRAVADDAGDGNVDPAEIHALCRSNEERARRLKERIARVLDTYNRVNSHVNHELCHLDLKLQAEERYSLDVEDVLLHPRAGTEGGGGAAAAAGGGGGGGGGGPE